MKIKDFAVGQKAYTLQEWVGRTTPPETEKVIITGVGRKFVKAAKECGWPPMLFYDRNEEDYLTEKVEAGEPRKLFPSKESLDAYVEQVETFKMIRKAFEGLNARKYTLTQLRAIRKILEE